ncbi:hypothetical protein EGW08_013801, partial [Elysia chlorotica]
MTKHLVYYPDYRTTFSYGMVDLYTELKGSHREITLRPTEKPIIVRFEKTYVGSKRKEFRTGEEMVMDVVESGGDVVDSTCIIFAVAHTDSFNLSLGINIEGQYNYSFAAISALYPSEYLKFIDAEFATTGSSISYFMPKAPAFYKYNFPLSRYFFMVRVPTVFGTGFGRGAGSWSAASAVNYSSAKVTKVKLYVRIYRTDCYYMIQQTWRNDEKCR